MVKMTKIEKLKGYLLGSDGELYKEGFEVGGKKYGFRKMKKQPPNRWKIKGNWISRLQIDQMLYEQNK